MKNTARIDSCVMNLYMNLSVAVFQILLPFYIITKDQILKTQILLQLLLPS